MQNDECIFVVIVFVVIVCFLCVPPGSSDVYIPEGFRALFVGDVL